MSSALSLNYILEETKKVSITLGEEKRLFEEERLTFYPKLLKNIFFLFHFFVSYMTVIPKKKHKTRIRFNFTAQNRNIGKLGVFRLVFLSFKTIQNCYTSDGLITFAISEGGRRPLPQPGCTF